MPNQYQLIHKQDGTIVFDPVPT
jgi:hypothetical protein